MSEFSDHNFSSGDTVEVLDMECKWHPGKIVLITNSTPPNVRFVILLSTGKEARITLPLGRNYIRKVVSPAASSPQSSNDAGTEGATQ